MSKRAETMYCDHCAEPGADIRVASLPVDIASASKGESATLCKTCAAEKIPEKIRAQEGGQVCAPISGNFRAFKAALIAADRQVGRPCLPGCCYSAVSLGMFVVAHAKSLQTNTREVARLVCDGCLGAVGVDNILLASMPDSPRYVEALDLAEDLVIGIVTASDQNRPIKAADLWNEMIEAALACGREEGWEAIIKDPR
jgi:hypothetical protein